ncbi:MAG TPA: ATP-binding protein, partial [Ktedonobacterales bacterium]|nr:ATP-binding protein [Ktedonobacterales bacterium]
MAEDPQELEILPVEIHLPGLLKVLGEHLYSDPRVALRELIQNAHDSCVRRREEDVAVAGAYVPAIRVRIDHSARQIVIDDNGSGLTRDEINIFLATVGRGYTRELRERLGGAERDEALELIGMFGLGLLSAFMIATRVEITTASYQAPDVAWQWISEGGQSYALRSAHRSGWAGTTGRSGANSVGTTVRLDLRDDARFLLEPGVLVDALRTYAEFLPIPITVGDDQELINGRVAPWLIETEPGPARNAQYLAWVEERRGMRPLAVLPLDDVTTDTGEVIP